MAITPETENQVDRFAPYVEELQQFFKELGLHTGSPEDIVPFAERLGQPGSLREDMASMVRSIMFREGGSVPRVQLLGMVTAAIGGPPKDEDGQQFLEPVRKLMAFLGEVHQARWGVPEESAETVATVDEKRSSEESSEAAKEVDFGPPPERPESDFLTRAREAHPWPKVFEADDEGEAAPVAAEATVVVAETTVEAASAVEAAPVDVAPDVDAAPASDVLPVRAVGVADDEEDVPWIRRRRSHWILGGAVAALAVFGAVMVYQGSRTGGGANRTEPVITPVATPAPAPAPARAAAPAAVVQKPSAYGQPASARPVKAPATRAPIIVPEDGSEPPRQDTVVRMVPVPPAASVPAQRAPAVRVKPPAPIYRVTPEGEFHDLHGTPPPAKPLPPEPQASLVVPARVMEKKLISAPAPHYPALASFAHIQGPVTLQAVVSRKGKVVATRVLNGHRLLRGAASDAVKKWRYRPYVLDGRPRNVATLVTVDFRLGR